MGYGMDLVWKVIPYLSNIEQITWYYNINAIFGFLGLGTRVSSYGISVAQLVNWKLEYPA